MSGFSRGDVVLVDLEPVRGHEQGANPRRGPYRPCVVVSDARLLNDYFTVYTIVPFTTSEVTLSDSLAPLVATPTPRDASTTSRALIPQVRSIDPERITRKVNSMAEQEMAKISAGLKALLCL